MRNPLKIHLFLLNFENFSYTYKNGNIKDSFTTKGEFSLWNAFHAIYLLSCIFNEIYYIFYKI